MIAEEKGVHMQSSRPADRAGTVFFSRGTRYRLGTVEKARIISHTGKFRQQKVQDHQVHLAGQLRHRPRAGPDLDDAVVSLGKQNADIRSSTGIPVYHQNGCFSSRSSFVCFSTKSKAFRMDALKLSIRIAGGL